MNSWFSLTGLVVGQFFGSFFGHESCKKERVTPRIEIFTHLRTTCVTSLAHFQTTPWQKDDD